MSDNEGNQEIAHQQMNNDQDNDADIPNDDDSDSRPDTETEETQFEDEEDAVVFQGISRHLYRKIKKLKRRSAVFKHDFDAYLGGADKVRMGRILAERSGNLVDARMVLDNRRSVRLIFQGPFQQNPFLETFSFGHEDGITALSLKQRDFQCLFGFLETAPTLRSLSLCAVKMDADGINNLVTSSLLSLQLKTLSFRIFDIEHDVFKDAITSINSSALKELNIVGCCAGRETCQSITRMLLDKNSSALEVLDLSINELDDECVRLLCDSLKTNTNLKHLSLGDNDDITEEGWMAVRNLVFDTTSLQHVYESNHVLQSVQCDYFTPMHMHCMLHEGLAVNQSCYGHEDDSPIEMLLKIRGREKVFGLLFPMWGDGINMEALNEFEPSLMPHLLGFINGDDNMFALENVFEIIRYWKMPTLYSFFPGAKVRDSAHHIDEPKTKKCRTMEKEA